MLRLRLENMGARFEPDHKVHFFELPETPDMERMLSLYALDSAYAALAAPETIVRFRAYVQLAEYRARLRGGYAYLATEDAATIARNEIENALALGGP
jgi:hypothetical protein